MISFRSLPRTTGTWVGEQTNKARTGLNRWGQVSRDDVLNELQILRTRVENQLPITQEHVEHLGTLMGNRFVDLSTQVQQAASKIEKPTKWGKRVWLAAGIGLGFVAATTATVIVLRRRTTQQDESATIDTAEHHAQHLANHHEPKGLRSIVQTMSHRNERHGTHSHATLGVATQAIDVAETYLVVGNVRTRSYVASTSANLPAEDHRIYFHTEQEAIDAGYHAAIDGI